MQIEGVGGTPAAAGEDVPRESFAELLLLASPTRLARGSCRRPERPRCSTLPQVFAGSGSCRPGNGGSASGRTGLTTSHFVSFESDKTQVQEVKFAHLWLPLPCFDMVLNNSGKEKCAAGKTYILFRDHHHLHTEPDLHQTDIHDTYMLRCFWGQLVKSRFNKLALSGSFCLLHFMASDRGQIIVKIAQKYVSSV